MVPDGWERIDLGTLLDFQNGVNTEAANYGRGSKFVNVMDIFENRFLTQERIRGTVAVSPRQDAAYALRRGDILFNRTSETFDEIALSSVYLDDAHAIFGGFVIRGRPKTGKLLPEFSCYCFSSSPVRREMVRRGQGAIRANIGQGDLSEVQLLLPPLPEQKKIAEILSTWDKAIETTEKLLANAETQKRALMQQLLTGKRRLKGFEGIGWRSGTLGDYVNVVSGPAFQSDSFAKEGVRLLRGSNVKRGMLDWADGITVFWPNDSGLEKYHIQAGDIVIAMDGYVGRSHAFFPCDPEPPVLLVQRVARLRTAEAVPHFIYAHICSDAFVMHCEQRKTSTAIAHITMNDIREFPIAWPAFEEQKAIGAVLTAATQKIDATKMQLEKLRSEKRGLMQQLLTGKKRVAV